MGNSYWSRQERGEDWLGESLRVVGTGSWVEVGSGPLVWGQAGHTTPAGGEGHRVRELGKVVSCGGSGEIIADLCGDAASKRKAGGYQRANGGRFSLTEGASDDYLTVFT